MKKIFYLEESKEFQKSHTQESATDAVSYCESIWQNPNHLSIYYAKLFILQSGVCLSLGNPERYQDASVRQGPFLLYTNSKLNIFSDISDNLLQERYIWPALYLSGSWWLLWLPQLFSWSVSQSATQTAIPKWWHHFWSTSRRFSVTAPTVLMHTLPSGNKH